MDRFNLGSHRRPVTTTSADAQKYFDLGLNWAFGFNHEEAAKCFRQALEHDPTCAMAHWGIAYASGPFYNYPWRHFGESELAERTAICHRHTAFAHELADGSTEVEQALIQALARRSQEPNAVEPDTLDRWDADYANAMRAVHERFPDDLDVAALLVEALVTRTPWRLWDVATGQPAPGADTLEAIDVCEKAIERADTLGIAQHPMILHMHIHALEMSSVPEQGLRSADELAQMCPDAGHMNHMPGHIYVLCGEYDKARLASIRAIEADDQFVAYAGAFNFYTTARCHDLHLMMYTCMLMGRYHDALAAADQICDTITADMLGLEGVPQLVATLEGYHSMRMHVLVRFGRWADIVAAPMPPDQTLYPVSTSMYHYAKGVANATLKQFDRAAEHRAELAAAIERIPPDRRFFNNAALDIASIGLAMLDGELAYHQGDFERGFERLRNAVEQDDNLAYTEPWAWMHPPRHALGALLAEQGHFPEAEAVYRSDLGLDSGIRRCSQHPNNIWALHGLVECLEQRGATNDLAAFAPQLAAAEALADTKITSSCMCRGAS